VTAVLDAFMAAERPAIEAVLERLAEGLAPPLGPAAVYALRAGGKRVRPLLTAASWRAAGGEGETPASIHGVGAAVELVHTYSLLHDDLPAMDDDPVRRGLPTTHLVHGVPTATAAGLALQHLAFLALREAAASDAAVAEALPELVRRLAQGAGAEGMVGGQLLDLEAEGKDLHADHLEAIHRMKTAALISAACIMGGVAAGAPEEDVRALGEYGRSLGLAFQIVDDLLDVSGDPARTGKRTGADVERRKATYPAVHGEAEARALAEAAGETARAALAGLPGKTDMLEAFVDFVLLRLH